MYKTFAGKYRTSVSKIACKYKKNNLFTVQYENNKGQVKQQTFYNESFKRQKSKVDKQLDTIPIIIHTNRTSLIDRLKAEKCEKCGATGKLYMHHVRKLKNLDGKGYADKLMIARRRKTIALCGSCHQRTHAGILD